MKNHRIRLSHNPKGRVLIHRDNKDPALVFVHLPAMRLRMTEEEVITLSNALVDAMEDK